MVELPTEKRPIDRRWISQKFLMIGNSGIGKSAFWAQGDKTLFLECEAGLNELEVMPVPCRSWTDVRETYNLLYTKQEEASFPYDTIIIDTIDRLVDYANEQTVELAKKKYKPETTAKINVVGDVPEGNGWDARKNMLLMMLNKFEQLPCAIAVIGHINLREIKDGNNKIHKETISIGGQLGGGILAWADHIMNIKSTTEGDQTIRTVRTLPHQLIEAKSRGGVIPNNWQWNASDKVNYDKFVTLFK